MLQGAAGKEIEMEEGKLAGFMHGTLHITILDATAPYGPSSSPGCPMNNCLSWRRDRRHPQPAFVTIELAEAAVAETTHELDGVWNQTFAILCAHPGNAAVTMTLRTRLSVLGRVRIPGSRLLDGDEDPAGGDASSFPLLDAKGKPGSVSKLRYRLRFERAECEPGWGRGLGDDGAGLFRGLVHGVSFPQRSNCDVVLYQDAHHRRSFRPPPVFDTTTPPTTRRLWEDVYRAIEGAKHLIYIAGWSLNPDLVLVRDSDTELPEEAVGVELGDLLRRKADDGVAVRVMLWDDETSLPFVGNRGLMHTHDEDASAFFRHTKVACRLCPRLHNSLPTLFAHHQKTISVDAPRGLFFDGDYSTSREIVSFLGGLDLCDGRYDTEQHSLFRTLNAGQPHARDFYQTSIPGADLRRGGPRQPWHDVHSLVAGAAAYDVLANFEQRWRKQCDPSLLVPSNELPGIRQAADDDPDIAGDGKDGWTVQVFRSIDLHSTDRLPEGGTTAECSIHEAYVRAIRRAKNFVYIENQYFIGGCHLWDEDRNCGCPNLIPVEIALKIASKVRSGDRFAAYIVVPMWPEGEPESGPVQEILHWTRLTMGMMYRVIGGAIRQSGAVAGAQPRDYLSFFCLANREEKRSGELSPASAPPHGTQYWNSQTKRRFMIYVHSKLMIVDDEYLLIGSANVNQRSMDGRRDTEIAVGCHQPSHVGGRSKAAPPRGDVHSYRLSLWYEHTGAVREAFREPQGAACARELNALADSAWETYSGGAVAEMAPAHLVSYPISVSGDGSIAGDRPVHEGRGVFPDTGAHVSGSKSWLLPPLLTT